jgi:Uncharacterized protein conserved in bacteria (DUF2252)
MSRISPGVLAPPHEILAADEWRARGRARRERVDPAEHARWDPPPDRPNPVATLQEQTATRVPRQVPVRYGRMPTSPFAYFRGAAAPMARDPAPTTDLRVRCCGDAHSLNVGMVAASDRRLVSDVNDLDETLPASFEWDVNRRAAGFAVAARDDGFSRQAHAAARRCSRSCRTQTAHYATMHCPNVWYSRIDVDEVTRTFDAVQPLFLRLTKAQESVLAPFASTGEYQHQGERVARGERMTQAATGEFLGWTNGIAADRRNSRYYRVRQLRGVKGTMDVPAMEPGQPSYYGRLCGWALARGHARTGRATVISGYLGSSKEFDDTIADFALAYADQNEADFALAYADQNEADCSRLLGAVANGRGQALTALLLAGPRPPFTGPLLPQPGVPGPCVAVVGARPG